MARWTGVTEFGQGSHHWPVELVADAGGYELVTLIDQGRRCRRTVPGAAVDVHFRCAARSNPLVSTVRVARLPCSWTVARPRPVTRFVGTGRTSAANPRFAGGDDEPPEVIAMIVAIAPTTAMMAARSRPPVSRDVPGGRVRLHFRHRRQRLESRSACPWPRPEPLCARRTPRPRLR